MARIAASPPPQPSPIKGSGVPSLDQIVDYLRRYGDIALALGIVCILMVLILPLPQVAARLLARDVDHLLGADPDDGAVHLAPARFLARSRPCC